MPSLTLAEKASLVTPSEYLILKVLIELRDKYDYVNEDLIKSRLSFTDSEFITSITKLLNIRAISQDRIQGKRAYRLTFNGLDILAIKMLYVNKIVKRLGLIIGEGKESNVYYGYDFDENIIAIKFHRVGKTSYKNARKLRGYKEKKSWITITLDNAKNEYSALKCLNSNYGLVPKPLGYSFNAVAMEYIDGISLIKSEVSNPKKVLDNILGTIRIAYTNCGIVHGDLSPYNIILDKEETPYIIDWPQSKRDNLELLNRDLNIILTFFKNKYNIMEDINEILDFVKGKV
ncbi:serine/threonine protein kinase [Acidianus sulfidivorans JP7]|uniref:non-specific serine/threonine protein kinase n=1 Tax=Acidianus sulfidivorans JP7 TaxID=619593 RepID=A0A2U9IMS0_9CREN|nr:RIO1 family regulatory kinase/ATPase [Acidianus sulfidivorans]AWR97328.1 serine/threonine protein kinase [Acidianus sulfidivorans JP7]